MKKDLLIFFITLILLINLTGCLEEKNENDDNKIHGTYNNKDELNYFSNITMMTAREFSSIINETINGSNYTIDLNGLQGGDKILIVDTIDDIKYQDGNTSIIFEFQENSRGSERHVFIFQDNITSDYNIGDKVEINLTIEHKTFNDSIINYDIEIFKEQWESIEYYTKTIYHSNPYKSLQKSTIKKTNIYGYTLFFKNSWNTSNILYTYDKNSSTYLTTYNKLNDSNWTDWIVFENLDEDECSKVRFLAYNIQNNKQPVMHCQVKINDTDNNRSVIVYDTINGSFQWPDASNYSQGDWCEASFTETVVDKAMIRFRAIDGSSVRPKLYEFELT